MSNDDADLGATLASSQPATAAPQEHIGRYEIQGVLGAGAMGRVLAAWDPSLKRQVALKMLQSEGASDDLRERLLREAEAAARVTHGNVVTVHDVGRHEGQVFVAMELVDGSLRSWAREPHTIEQVVGLFTGAARGLAAVHAAGLVHRDFKPDNVLVRHGTVPLISDFGLVGVLGGTTARPLEGGAAGLQLTHAGSLLGTPVYMAPELWDGKPATPESDQFAFGVSLHEALFGQRPFDASGVHELADVIKRGQPRPGTRPIPSWLAEVLRRCLAVDPKQRFPSMAAVADALEEGPRAAQRRRRALTGALVAMGAAVVAVFGAQRALRPSCVGFEAQREALWSQQLRPRVSAAMPGSLQRLDEGFRAWASTASTRCEAFADGAVEPTAWSREQECYATAFEDLELGARLAAENDAEAATLLAKARDPLACSTVKDYRRRQPLPAAEEDRKHAALLFSRALASLTRMETDGDAALAEARATATEGDALGYQPVVSRAYSALGTIHNNRGEYTEALEAFRRAQTSAEAARDDGLLASAALLRAQVECNALSDANACSASLAVAETLMKRVSSPALASLYLRQRVGLDLLELRPEQAVRRLREEEKKAPLGGSLVDFMFDALLADGRFSEASEWAIAAMKREGADRDPRGTVTLAMAHIAMGRLDDADRAIQHLGELIEGREELASYMADLLSLRAQAVMYRGRSDEAAALQEQSTTLIPELGQDPAQVPNLLESGKVDEAKAFERSILLDHPRFKEHRIDLRGLSDLLPLALIQRATGRSREAIDTLDWMEKSIRAQAGDTCWALADVISSRCMMALEHEPLEVSGRCLDRLEALAASREGPRGPQHAVPPKLLRAEWHLRRKEPQSALALLDPFLAEARALGYRDAALRAVVALDDEAKVLLGDRKACGSLAENLAALAKESPGFYGLDRTRQSATRASCR